MLIKCLVLQSFLFNCLYSNKCASVLFSFLSSFKKSCECMRVKLFDLPVKEEYNRQRQLPCSLHGCSQARALGA